MSNAAVTALTQVVLSETQAANEIAERINSARGNHAKMLSEIREESTDERLVAYREKRDKQEALMLKLREEADKIAAELGGLATLSEDELSESEKEYQEHAKAAKGAAKLVVGMVGKDNAPEFPEIVRFKSGKKREGSTGSNTRRLRFDAITLNGEPVKNLSAVAQKIKSETGKTVTAAELQEVLFKEAGTDDVSKMNGVEFGVTETDKDGKTHTYNVQVFKSPVPETE